VVVKAKSQAHQDEILRRAQNRVRFRRLQLDHKPSPSRWAAAVEAC